MTYFKYVTLKVKTHNVVAPSTVWQIKAKQKFVINLGDIWLHFQLVIFDCHSFSKVNRITPAYTK